MDLTPQPNRDIAPHIRLWALVQLVHPLPVLIVMSAAVLFGLVATAGAPVVGRLSLMLLALLGGQMLIGSLNEYHDRDLDARAQRKKPIPSGLIGARAALWMMGVGGALFIVSGAALGWSCLLLAIAGTGSGVVYDVWLKGTALSWFPYFVALPLLPVWVWTCLAQFEPRLLVLYPVGAPVVVAIHLAQSLPDVDADRSHNSNGLAVRLGTERGFWVVCAMTLLAVVEATVCGIFFGDRPHLIMLPAAIGVILVTVLIAGRRSARDLVDRNLFAVVALLTVGMGLGLVGAIGP